MDNSAHSHDDIRMPLTLADVTKEHLEKLKELFPEAFTEGKVDFDRLRQALGDVIETGRERYGLSWAGKADAIRAIQAPSVGTLIPVPEESVNFDATENLIIEGENLEVLKLLQKSYHGKVKIIYIDPPYNTGNEFIYPDDYKEPLKQYLRLTGQVSEEGIRLTTNAETSGRYHSNWLSMMYPRLFLARNLLRDDGVIFVSIDDHEVQNLRILMNEIFGEENCICCITVVSNPRGRQSDTHVASVHDYLVCYAKNAGTFKTGGAPLTEAQRAEFKYQDDKGNYRLLGLRQRGAASRREDRPDMFFPIYVRKDGSSVSLSVPSDDEWVVVYPRKSDGSDGRWMWGKDKVARDIALLVPRLIESRQEFDIFVKDYLAKEGEERKRKYKTIWNVSYVNNQAGTQEVKQLLGSDVMSHPKPVGLLKDVCRMGCPNDGLVLDFFAGSGTTAHAVLDLNKQDRGNRKFILVQLPEPLDPNNKDQKAGADFCDSIGKPRNIAEITKERVRRVIQKLNDGDKGKLDLNDDKKQDRGFRVFKLLTSNFKIWEGEKVPRDAEGLAEQLKLYADHVLEGRPQRDILYELILKAGLPLTAKIGEKSVTGKTIYSVADGLLLICLEDEVTAELLRGMMNLKPQQILCLDRAFRGNDQLKTNTVLEMKQRKITFHTV